MTVKELIEALAKLDPSLKVHTGWRDGDYTNEVEPDDLVKRKSNLLTHNGSYTSCEILLIDGSGQLGN